MFGLFAIWCMIFLYKRSYNQPIYRIIYIGIDTFLLLFSINVTLSIVESIQKRILNNNPGVNVHSNSDLGQISEIFIDKTGTLT